MRSLFWRLQQLNWRCLFAGGICGIVLVSWCPWRAEAGLWPLPGSSNVSESGGSLSSASGIHLASVLPDTLRHFNPHGEQRHYAVDTSLASGFVYGTNRFFDQAKATSFTLERIPGSEPARVRSLRIWFGYKKDNLPSSTGYKVALYSGGPGQGPQGDPIAYFLPLVSAIQADADLETVSVPTVLSFDPIEVPDQFFVSVEFGSLSNTPGALEIVATGPVGARVAEVWEQNSTGAWQNISDAWWTGQPEGAQLWIEAVVEAEIATGTDDPEIPAATRLYPNYPNPFNPATVIRYEIRQAGPVNLSVYDLTGRLVAVLIDGHQSPGAYEVTFDGRERASGVYLYRLTTGEHVQTRKMLLVK